MRVVALYHQNQRKRFGPDETWKTTSRAPTTNVAANEIAVVSCRPVNPNPYVGSRSGRISSRSRNHNNVTGREKLLGVGKR